MEQVVKRIRNHPSVVHWVGANESSAVEGTEELIKRLTGTTSWMRQSECDGVHNGSPYYPVNPMGYYADTASSRGSREAWNLAMNRATGVLFWYNNTPVPQLGSHAWDYDLDQTASFFAQKGALAPLHAQYEYLSNRVSVVNDTCADRRLAVRADVYDFESRRVWERSAEVLSRGESCVDVFVIPFNELASRIPLLAKPHFVKLRLVEGDREVDSTFYWRSSSAYEGQDTATGPYTGGFAALADLPRADVRLVREGERTTLTVEGHPEDCSFVLSGRF